MIALYFCGSRAFLSDDARDIISASFADAGLGMIEELREPLTAYRGTFGASSDGNRSRDVKTLLSEGPWIALIVLAAIIILFCIVGMVVICFTWGRYVETIFTWGRYVETIFTWGRYVETIFTWGRYVETIFTWGRYVETIFTWGRYVETICAWGRYVETIFTWGRYVETIFQTYIQCVPLIYLSDAY